MKYYVSARESRYITVEVEASNRAEAEKEAIEVIFNNYTESDWDYGDDFEVWHIEETEEPEDLPLETTARGQTD